MVRSSPNVQIIGMLFPILGTLAVAGRFLARHKRRVGFGLDDWLCIPASCSIAGLGGLVIYGANERAFDAGNGTSADDNAANPARVELSAHLYTIFVMIQTPVVALIKTVILLLYGRIFTGRTFNIWNRLLIFLMMAWATAFVFTFLFACGTHVSEIWSLFPGAANPSSCIDQWGVIAVNALIDVILDCIVAAFPLFWIWRLRIRKSRKIKVTVMFWGSVAIGSSIAHSIIQFETQTVYGAHANRTTTIAGIPASDRIGLITFSVFWGYAEIGIGLCACCLPSLLSLLDECRVTKCYKGLKTKIGLGNREQDVGLKKPTINHSPAVALDVQECSEGTKQCKSYAGDLAQFEMEKTSIPGVHVRGTNMRMYEGAEVVQSILRLP